MKNKTKNGSGFHIVKRPAISWGKAMGIRALALLVAIGVCAIVTWALTRESPLGVMQTIFLGSFASQRRFWVMMQDLSVLLLISLAMAPAFRMKFWNIGGEGQVMIGCLATAACMISFGNHMANWQIILLSLISAVAAGAIWGIIPAACKAKWDTNETLFTLMMNYVAIQLCAYFIIKWENPKGSGKVGIINQKSQAGWLPVIGRYKYLLTVIVAAAVMVFMFCYMNFSKHGYELAVVGESRNTARYVGIGVGKVIIRTMALSGAICGLTGFMLVAGSEHSITTTLAGGRGFTAVLVAWMAKFNPFGMIFTSFLITFMSKGAGEVASNFNLNESFSDILTSIIIFFLIGCEFFIQYRIVRKKEAK